MTNINDFERQKLLLDLMDRHRDFMVLAQTKELNKEVLKQFQLMDNIVQEMLKSNAKELGLYQEPET